MYENQHKLNEINSLSKEQYKRFIELREKYKKRDKIDILISLAKNKNL